jgi:hypothetical protein
MGVVHFGALLVAVALGLQLSPRMDALVAAVRPLLPYPAASADGDIPADNGTTTKWFVVWPADAQETRIIVRANPLNPEVQKASVKAMEQINAAVTAAERRAQAAYERALEQLRTTGKAGELEAVSLEDEGVAGERIDAELELTIELAPADSYEVASGEAPTVTAAATGGAWIVAVPANTYRDAAAGQREHFRAAESRIYFGLTDRPSITQSGDGPRYRVRVAPAQDAFAVVLRGNASLLSTLVSSADWARLVSR